MKDESTLIFLGQGTSREVTDLYNAWVKSSKDKLSAMSVLKVPDPFEKSSSNIRLFVWAVINESDEP